MGLICKLEKPPFLLNQEQQEANDLILKGESICILGIAGTGKTSSVTRGISDLLPTYPSIEITHKHLPPRIAPILLVAYTNKAVNRMRECIAPELKHLCITIHKALEYTLEITEDISKDGHLIKKMISYPRRTVHNPLIGIKLVVMEEATLTNLELNKELMDALPADVQVVLLGDLNQLKPVFGDSILQHKVLSTKTVILKDVHRQEKESPVLKFLYDICAGRKNHPKIWAKQTPWGNLNINILPRAYSADGLISLSAQIFKKIIADGSFIPFEDIVLIPYNKAFGTIVINSIINEEVSIRAGEETHHIITGSTSHYWAVGDCVMWEHQQGKIIGIEVNNKYTGLPCNPPEVGLKRFDVVKPPVEELIPAPRGKEFDLTKMTTRSIKEIDQGLCSHTITIEFTDPSLGVTSISARGDIMNLQGGHALTIHKSQGSEWKKVFLFLNKVHANMICRELLFTGASRASHTLNIITDAGIINKAIDTPKIVGNSQEEKLDYLRSNEL